MIGRPLVRQLALDERADVIVADIYSEPAELPPGLKYYNVSDGNDGFAFAFSLHKPEYVFHLAGAKGGAGIGRTHGMDFLLANLKSTIDVVEMATAYSIKRLMLTSSVGAYPGNKSIFKESDAWDGEPHQSDYFGGYAKRFGELMCKAAQEQYGLDYVVVRPTNIFGPHDRFDAKTSMVIGAFIARLESGENPLVVHANKSAMRDFLYSSECARGMIAAMKYGRSSEIYNLGTGKVVSIEQVAVMLCEIYGRSLEFIHEVDGSPQIRVMDMSKSSRELGFTANNGSIKRQLDETVKWLKANKDVEKYDPFKEAVDEQGR